MGTITNVLLLSLQYVSLLNRFNRNMFQSLCYCGEVLETSCEVRLTEKSDSGGEIFTP